MTKKSSELSAPTGCFCWLQVLYLQCAANTAIAKTHIGDYLMEVSEMSKRNKRNREIGVKVMEDNETRILKDEHEDLQEEESNMEGNHQEEQGCQENVRQVDVESQEEVPEVQQELPKEEIPELLLWEPKQEDGHNEPVVEHQPELTSQVVNEALEGVEEEHLDHGVVERDSQEMLTAPVVDIPEQHLPQQPEQHHIPEEAVQIAKEMAVAVLERPVVQRTVYDDIGDVLASGGYTPAPPVVGKPSNTKDIRARVFSALTYDDQDSNQLRAKTGVSAKQFPQSWLKSQSELGLCVRTVRGDHRCLYRLPRPPQS